MPLQSHSTYRPVTFSVAGDISFGHRLADAIRQVRQSAVIRTTKDRRLLTDLARGRGIVQLERLANVTRTCTDPADATALADCFRGYALAGRRAITSLTLVEALRAEGETDGPEDQAVFEFYANPCLATRQRAIEALRRVVETSLTAIDALHRERVS